jgi:hypothetical protein
MMLQHVPDVPVRESGRRVLIRVAGMRGANPFRQGR